MNYEQTTPAAMAAASEPISVDSDRESNKSDSDSEPVPCKEQDMFIWSPKYEVCSKLGDIIAGSGIAHRPLVEDQFWWVCSKEGVNLMFTGTFPLTGLGWA